MSQGTKSESESELESDSESERGRGRGGCIMLEELKVGAASESESGPVS
jgi:hypothetical protein